MRPRLLYDLSAIDIGDGFALEAAVQPSPLGPYMVDAYGDHRYYIRHGSSTEPMGEREVRDMYALAARGRDELAQRWAHHRFPHRPSGGDVWVVTSAMPHQPLTSLPIEASGWDYYDNPEGVHEHRSGAGRSRRA